MEININREDIAWAAGLFEGEGCINKGKSGYRRITMSMTDKDVIEKFDSIFPFHPKIRVYHKPPNKKVYIWQISGGEAVQAFLAMVWPWLGDRRREAAREAIQWINDTDRTRSRKLTAEQVREIRELYTIGNRWRPGNGQELAERFGVSKSYISALAGRKRLKTVRES